MTTYPQNSLPVADRVVRASESCLLSVTGFSSAPEAAKRKIDEKLADNVYSVELVGYLVDIIKIDPTDQYLLSAYPWRLHKTAAKQHPYVFYSYRCKREKRTKALYLHRLIVNAPAGMVVDHINGDTLDNRRSNLRICTQRENMLNTRRHREVNP